MAKPFLFVLQIDGDMDNTPKEAIGEICSGIIKNVVESIERGIESVERGIEKGIEGIERGIESVEIGSNKGIDGEEEKDTGN